MHKLDPLTQSETAEQPIFRVCVIKLKTLLFIGPSYKTVGVFEIKHMLYLEAILIFVGANNVFKNTPTK